MTAILPILEDVRHKVTIDEVSELMKAGYFEEPSRIELIEGIIVEMPHEGLEHADWKMLVGEWLIGVLPSTHRVMIDTTLHLPPHNAPSPDAWVYPRQMDLKDVSGSDVSLIIETADASLRKDTVVKAPLYARFGVQEYWIIDIEAKEVLVFLPEPQGGYCEPSRYAEDTSVACKSIPGLTLRLADLRP